MVMPLDGDDIRARSWMVSLGGLIQSTTTSHLEEIEAKMLGMVAEAGVRWTGQDSRDGTLVYVVFLRGISK